MYIAKTDSWYLERAIWVVSGSVILVSLALSLTLSPYWLILTGLVGINLIIFGLTGFCLMANILKLAGLESRVK